MFTGIITDVGTVVHREDRGDTLFRVETAYTADKHGYRRQHLLQRRVHDGDRHQSDQRGPRDLRF